MASEASIPPSTRRFLHGTRQIVEFNWPQYLAAAVVVGGALVLAQMTDAGWPRAMLIGGAALTMWWTVASIAASFWIYDATGLTDWQWLKSVVHAPRHWVNVHAGVDETTRPLRAVFPASTGRMVDIYDAKVTTESSVARARNSNEDALRGSYDRLPLASDSCDAAFLLFAAHELRSTDQRAALFDEVERVLRAGGRLVLVEHGRDLANFSAFGPGFMHFLSPAVWPRAAAGTTLQQVCTRRLNPFVLLAVWEKRS